MYGSYIQLLRTIQAQEYNSVIFNEKKKELNERLDEIKVSRITGSKYLNIYIDEVWYTFRFSDHPVFREKKNYYYFDYPFLNEEAINVFAELVSSLWDQIRKTKPYKYKDFDSFCESISMWEHIY